MGLLREILRASKQYGPEALRAVREQIRAGGVNLKQAEDALRTVGVTLQQEGNAAGRRILSRVDPQLQRVLDTDRQAKASAAVRRLQERRDVQRSAQAGPPAPEPRWQRSYPSDKPAPEPQWGPGRRQALPPSQASRPTYPTVEEIQSQAPRITGPAFEPGSTFYQPNLPNPRGAGGKFQSIYGEPREVIARRQRMAVPVGEPVAQGPSVSPGQLAFDALGMQEPTGPLGRQLLNTDPQTYKSISNIALDATRYYGRSVTPEDLLGPRGTDILRELEAGSAIVPSPRGALGSIYAPKAEVIVDPDISDVFRNVEKGTPANAPFPEALRQLGAGPEAVYSGRAAAIPNMDIIADTLNEAVLRNAVGGVRKADLGRFLAQAAGVGAAGFGLGVGGAYLLDKARAPQQDQQIPDALLYPPQDGAPLSETPEGIPVAGGNSLMYPAVQGNQDTVPVQPILPAPGQIGAGSVIIRTNDNASNRRQALANAEAGAGMFQPRPEAYRQPKDFYRAASAYGRQPGVVENLQEQLSSQSARMGQADMQSWVRANPGLAYQLSLRNAPRDVSQQTPNIQGAEIVTELGSQNENNVIGNTAEAVRVAGGAPGDLKQATDPRLAVSLQRVPRDMQAFFNRPGFAGTSRLY